jgi:quinol monooxygenase YgiN
LKILKDDGGLKMLKIVAKRYLKDGVFDEYVQLVKTLADQSRKEPGCIEYALYVNREQNIAATMETWENQAFLDAHIEIVLAEGYPAKLNAYADPNQPAQIEKYEYVY